MAAQSTAAASRSSGRGIGGGARKKCGAGGKCADRVGPSVASRRTPECCAITSIDAAHRRDPTRKPAMTTALEQVPAARRPNAYAKCIDASKRIRWDIDRDVLRGRTLDFTKKFMPDSMSRVRELQFLGEDQQRLISQIQGRTYANVFGLVERFIGAKILEVSRDHWLGDQTALEALVRFTDEELKHQELFRRMERMTEAGMPSGYVFAPQPNEVASAVLGKSTWAVLGLTCCIELFTQAHYRQSIEPDAELSEVWKDVFLYHWREESQHAILDELEWLREDSKITARQRDAGVDDLIALVGAVDGIVQAQAAADAACFQTACGRGLSEAEAALVRQSFLRAYRWQFIGSGVTDSRFQKILGGMIDAAQMTRIGSALAPILQ
jgi:hypothetical protein